MRRLVYSVFLGIIFFCSVQFSCAQLSLSLSTGPQFALSYVTHGEWKSTVKPGWGFNAGVIASSGDDHLMSFRGLLNYSLQAANIELLYLGGTYDGSHLEGTYWMSNIMFSPQLSCNLLKNKTMFIAIGPFMQYMFNASGSGTYGYYPQEHTPFSGNLPLASDQIFNAFNWGGGLSFGLQKITIGSVNLNLELRELMTVQSLLKEDRTNAEWLSCITSLTIGIEFYREKSNIISHS